MTGIVLFLLACYTQHLSLYLEIVVLTSVSCSCFLSLFGFVLICIVSLFLLSVCLFVTSFMSDCLYNRIMDLRNDMICMYVCMFIITLYFI